MKNYTINLVLASMFITASSLLSQLKAQNFCTLGCNSNAYINSQDPNTIEYDNLVSSFHASIAKEKDGNFKVWGQNSGSNGSSDLLSPTKIEAGTGNANFNYTGTPLKATTGSISNTGHQFVLLTTDGLYAWGNTNTLISSTIKSTTAFGKITINAKADGLPAGVSPSDVKMMFGSYQTLAIVTCQGEAWVLSMLGSKNGDGSTQNATNNVIWHRVKTSATGNPNLDKVVALRGTPNALIALTSEGKVFTWGTSTYINNNATSSNRTYATEISLPSGATPKMIGMTQASASQQTYYLLSTEGKLYAMGNNANRQLGDNSTTSSNNWKEVTATSGSNTLGGNIAWMSPNEHSNYDNSAAINVLTKNNKQWAWGSNSGNMIGGALSNSYYNPIFMPGNSTNANGLSLTDEVIAVETGGHTTVNVKKCSQNFGYIGHRTNGSMGDGTDTSSNPNTFSYATSILIVCGTDLGPSVKNLKICPNKTADLTNAILEDNPNEVEWHTSNDPESPLVTNIKSVGPGTYYAFYTVAAGKCRLVGSIITVSYYSSTEPDYPCPCFNPATSGNGPDTKMGITLLQRAGTQNLDNWPMLRKSGHIAIESNKKGFVINRLSTVEIEGQTSPSFIAPKISNPQEGMMVYDTDLNCIKLYADGAWKCFNTPACP